MHVKVKKKKKTEVKSVTLGEIRSKILGGKEKRREGNRVLNKSQSLQGPELGH